MLVLSRKNGEAVRIGKDIEIVIVYTKGGRVGLGIKAPRDLRVLRSELERAA